MPHPLAGAVAKINRATHNIIDLRKEIAGFVREHYFAVPEINGPFGPATIIRTKATEDDLVAIGVRVGEIVYQLRSSLDHIFWKLIEGNPRSYRHYRKFSFPIFAEADRYAAHRDQAAYRTIQGADALIESLQPFQKGDAFREDPLWILNRLGIVDRHRLLILTQSAIQFVVSRPDGSVDPGMCHPIDSKTGARIVNSDQVQMKVEAAGNVALGEIGAAVAPPVTDVLETIGAVVGRIAISASELLA